MQKLLLFSVFLLVSSWSFADVLLLPDPEAYWKFDETSGSITANSSSSSLNYTGTLTNFTGDNSQKWISGKYGNALRFIDSNDMVLLNNNVVDLTSNWTISAWFLSPLPSTGDSWHTLTRGAGGDHQVIAHRSSNELGMYDNVGGTSFHGSGFDMDSLNSSNGWKHIAAVGSGGTTTFYIDGINVGTANLQSVTDVFALGNYQGGHQRFADALDDMAIWNTTALTQQQVSLLAGNSVDVALNASAVPEPTSLTLLLLVGSVVLMRVGIGGRKKFYSR